MFQDARELPLGTKIETELAIIGAGPAGITIAREFIGTQRNVLLLESGGMEPEPEIQALAEGDSIGLDYPVGTSRVRVFGGSSYHWGGYCRPLDTVDFEIRIGVPGSGWPITRQELNPYYERALPFLQLGPMQFDRPSAWHKELGEEGLLFPCGRLSTRIFQFSTPTRFGSYYQKDFAEAKNVTVLLHANAVSIDTGELSPRVTGITVKTLGGTRLFVHAKAIVLATGGLENPRILLALNSLKGLGNEHDLVGRYFMEHPHLDGFADIVVGDIVRLPSLFLSRRTLFGVSAQAAFAPNETFLRKQGLLNVSFTVVVSHLPARKGIATEQR